MLLRLGLLTFLTSILLAGAGPLPRSDNAVDCQEVGQPSRGIHSSPDYCLPGGPLVQGSSVAKCLFNQPLLPIPSNSSGPKTPGRANSSQSDTSTSLPEISTTANCIDSNSHRDFAPIRCTVISSKRVTVSPNKQMMYTMERSHCISSPSPIRTNLKRQNMREHVKGRLDFDGSSEATNTDNPIVDEVSTFESDKALDIFDMDLPNLDALGDFSFSEMLGDLDLDCEGIAYTCSPTSGGSVDSISGYCSSSSLLYFSFKFAPLNHLASAHATCYLTLFFASGLKIIISRVSGRKCGGSSSYIRIFTNSNRSTI